MEEAVWDGAIPDCTPDQFYAQTQAWCRTTWQAPAKGWIDPVKEAQASGYAGVSRACRRWRRSAPSKDATRRDVADQKAAERTYYEVTLGIPYPGDQAPIGDKSWVEDEGVDGTIDDGQGVPPSGGAPAGKPATPAKPKPRVTQPAPKPPATGEAHPRNRVRAPGDCVMPRKPVPIRAVGRLVGQPWAMTREMLDTMVAIAHREDVIRQALGTVQGRDQGDTSETYVRGTVAGGALHRAPRSGTRRF